MTAVPWAARGVAPAYTLAVLGLVSGYSDSLPTQTHVHTHTYMKRSHFSLTTGGRDQVAGTSRRKEKGWARRLTNEPRQVTFTDVRGWRGRRGQRWV